MINNKVFVVCAPEYSENSGGSICVHHLADILASLGYTTYIAPLLTEINILSLKKFKSAVMHTFYLHLYKIKKVKSFPANKAKIINVLEAKSLVKKGAICIYTDTVLGNPYQAKKIVRWLLHYPMFFHKQVCWNQGEIVIRFNDNIPKQNLSGIIFLDQLLKIVKYPIDLYLSKISKDRSGSAYLIRKGIGKDIIHPPNSICIDGLSHHEIATILGKVQYFYSYDLYTAYSSLAAISGCVSIVVPDENVSILDWYPSIEDRYGISYGIENIKWAIETQSLVLKKLKKDEEININNTKLFIASLNKLENF